MSLQLLRAKPKAADLGTAKERGTVMNSEAERSIPTIRSDVFGQKLIIPPSEG
jgi:hypothetical protein